ncbi:hypothetical protein [Devosia sp.]|uniref:hypothetical protein n=1 Tax=Devosia sp. TaxID=1871048 RepID=UPI002F0FE976
MTLFGPLSRTLAATGLVAASLVAAAPAHAAKADVELLRSYIGTWDGKGVLVGAQSETVKCRLSLTAGNNDKVNYNGRCVIAGSPFSLNGTIAYIDAARRFEAAMTSNAGFSPQPAVGKRQGNGIVFSLKEQGRDDDGNDMTITAQIALHPGKIHVDMNVVFNATGNTLKASVPFSR